MKARVKVEADDGRAFTVTSVEVDTRIVNHVTGKATYVLIVEAEHDLKQEGTS